MRFNSLVNVGLDDVNHATFGELGAELVAADS